MPGASAGRTGRTSSPSRPARCGGSWSSRLERGAEKRGGGAESVPLEEAEAQLAVPEADLDLLSLDSALHALAAVDERKSRVVELRHFGGLSVEETAEVLGVSTITVLRDWKMAKIWLVRQMRRERPA